MTVEYFESRVTFHYAKMSVAVFVRKACYTWINTVRKSQSNLYVVWTMQIEHFQNIYYKT
jgi:hypothetical protein